jgi:hypothetical protein
MSTSAARHSRPVTKLASLLGSVAIAACLPRRAARRAARGYGAAAIFVHLLPGCGARSDLPVDTCVWTAPEGPPVALTEPIDESFYLPQSNIAVDDGRVWWSTLDYGATISSPRQIQIRALRDDLTMIGPSHVLDASDSTVNVPIAAGFGHRGGLVWDDSTGTSFVALAEDGSPSSGPVRIDPSVYGYALFATSRGFVALAGDPAPLDDFPFAVRYDGTLGFSTLRWLSLDPAGTLVHATSLVFALGWVPDVGARFDDGTLLLAGLVHDPVVEDPPSVDLYVEHTSEAGDILGQPQRVMRVASSADFDGRFRYAMTTLGSSALLAWTIDSTSLLVASVDADGNLGAPRTVATPEGGVGYFGVGAADGNVLVVWDSPTAAGRSLVIQPLSPEGEAKVAPLVLPAPAITEPININGAGVRVELAHDGALLLFAERRETPGQPPSGQVFVEHLSCRRAGADE